MANITKTLNGHNALTTTFGGEIFASDFDTVHPRRDGSKRGSSIAIRIASDLKNAKRCLQEANLHKNY